MNYAKIYDDYWTRPDRIGCHSFADANVLLEEIISTCGRGRTLDVGCGEGFLVSSLLASGIDSHGIDCSAAVIDRCQQKAPQRFRVGSALEIPFEDNSFETVVSTDMLEHIAEKDIPLVLQELRRVTSRNVFVKICVRPDSDNCWHLTVHSRSWWEKRFLEYGFRLHPRELFCFSYTDRNIACDPCTIILEKIPDAAFSLFPNDVLCVKRDLHMDMLRESGRRAEAHRMRYYAAAAEIRNRNVVLDLACGLGYGSHILYQNSLASKVIGIDANTDAIRYAQENYGIRDSISFFQNDAEKLSCLTDNSVDLIVGFEILEHLEDPERCLAECFRVLRPSGRVTASVPNNWADSSGKDPNPYHIHVYTWERLRGEFSRYFLPEKAYMQTAGVDARPDALRRWNEFDVASAVAPSGAEWLVLQGVKDIRGHESVPYVARDYPIPANSRFHDGNFGTDYINPWLYDGLLDRSRRTQNPEHVKAIAQSVADNAATDSADHALSLCVLAYDHLEEPNASYPPTLVDAIAKWLDNAGELPVEIRWRVSLHFVLGQIFLRHGKTMEAERAFTACASIDPLRYGPTLGTKVLSAWHNLALIALGRQDVPKAKQYLEQALRQIWLLFSEGGEECMGSVENPIWAYILDMRQALETAQACQTLMYSRDSWHIRPGYIHTANPLNPLRVPDPPHILLENSLRAWGLRLAGKDVYFWGYGQLYSLRKKFFPNCRPRYFLADIPGRCPEEFEGVPIRHPDEILPFEEKLPIVIFAWHPGSILKTIAEKYPQYGADDVIIVVHPEEI